MRKPRVLITEPEYFTPESLADIRKVGQVTAKRMSRRALFKAVKNADALVVRIETKVDRALLTRAKNLKCVVSATTGLNHIDVAFLKSRHIPIFSLHGTHSVSTAEHALALLFAVARRIPSASQHMISGDWKRWEFIGNELQNKTLGILGIGRIGKEVASRACGLGMKVIAYDPYVNEVEAHRRNAQKVSWKTFIKMSDIISLHSPLTSETKHMIGRKEFKAMKSSVILINTARAEIIEEKALLAALKNGEILAAAFDTYTEEPLPPRHPLRQYAKNYENLLLTPHLGASTREAISSASRYCAEAITRFFNS